MVTKIMGLHVSTGIPLSLATRLTYHLVPNGSSFQYTKPHSSILEIWLFYIALLRNASARYLCHPTIFSFVGIRPSLI